MLGTCSIHYFMMIWPDSSYGDVHEERPSRNEEVKTRENPKLLSQYYEEQRTIPAVRMCVEWNHL